MSNNKFFILVIFLVGLLSFSAVGATDNATGEIVCAEETPVMEQITAEEMECEVNVAALPELQNSTLNPDSTLNSDENPDGDFIALENDDSDVQSNSMDSSNPLTDGSSNEQSAHDIYGIVDLGSNVMSLNIFKEKNGEIEFILSDNRESITANYKEDNSLTPEGINRLILLLDDFDGIMDSNNVTVEYFFATASLRKLDNCGEVFTAVKNALGINLEILSEKEEAQAGFDAVRFVDLTDDDGILIDIGGGSCQVVPFMDKNPVSMESMPIGSRSCYEDYVSSMFPNETEILNIQKRVEMELGKLHANSSSPVDDLYGIGGTLFNVRQTLIYLNYIDNETYVIPLSTLDALLAKLLENTTETQRIISEVAPDRINTLIPGIVMARQISNHFQIKNIHFCKSRIEEGIVYELIYNYTLSEGTFQELQEEIDAASEGDTIYLRKNYVNDGSFSSEGINITKAITIEGNGFAIDAACFSRIFNINATKNVILNKIIFKNGFIDNGGAIIFNNNISNCIISNCGFLANNAYGNGGALYFKTIADVTIEDTIFNFNYAAENGGAIYFLDDSDSNTFKNTIFMNNVAEIEDGGAIYFFRNIINDVFENVTFMINVARNGGAINVNGDIESTLFNSTSFINNAARRNGGAIYVFHNSNSTVCKDTSFINNVASKEDGGAINYRGAVMNGLFDNVTFLNNLANNGGAIYANDDVVNTTIANSEFKDNFAASATNNIALNGEGAFQLDNVNPEDLGPTYLAFLTVINVTDNVKYGENVAITVNVTDRLHEPLNGTVSVMVNGKIHKANVENGFGKIILSGLNAGKYDLNVTYSGMIYIPASSVIFNVLKRNATISAASKAYVISYGGKYSITLKDTDGKLLTGKKVTFTLNGKRITSATTNANGVATIALTAKILKAAKAGKKNLVIKFADSNYNSALKTVKITINKEKTKLAAKNKKFKKAEKVKKYTVILKNSKGKGIKNVKVTLKVKGKRYTVKSNTKGKATFKIKNLKKKGKFATTITFNGNAYYNKVTKKVKITLK